MKTVQETDAFSCNNVTLKMFLVCLDGHSIFLPTIQSLLLIRCHQIILGGLRQS